MNERTMIIGMNKDKMGYYAMWANNNTIYSGDSPKEAINNLLDERKPGIWHINDTPPSLEILHKTKVGNLGTLPGRYFSMKKGKWICLYETAKKQNERR